MGATESRPRETQDSDGEEEIAVAVAVAVVGLGVAVAAGAAVVRLGVAAWNAVRSLASPSRLQHHQKRTFEFKVDASVKPIREDPYGPKKAGSGGVLRNEKGEFLCKFYEHLGKEDDITAAELKAIKGALEVFSEDKFRWDGQYDELIVANDNATAVRLAKGEQRPYNVQISLLLAEINTLKLILGEVGFIEIDREDNREADELADDGWKHSGPRVVSYNQSF